MSSLTAARVQMELSLGFHMLKPSSKIQIPREPLTLLLECLRQ